MTTTVRESQTMNDLIPVLDNLMEAYFDSIRACGASELCSDAFTSVLIESGWTRAVINTYLEKWEREGKLVVDEDCHKINGWWSIVRD